MRRGPPLVLKLSAFTACVDYADLLALGAERWASGLEAWTIVSTFEDEATAALAERIGARLHRTRAFQADGALFNKARALQEAREAAGSAPGEWTLFLDADVAPPEDWLGRLEVLGLKPGWLYGARRRQAGGKLIEDRELAGFFQLFRSDDPRGAAPLERDWLHAGNYDSAFMLRWPAPLRRILPLELEHAGEPGQNWCGRGNSEAMAKIRERRKTESWRSEKLGVRL